MAETTHHKVLKQVVQNTAVAEGWSTETEVSGVSATGKRWRADVVAIREERKIAFELQWSSQAHTDFSHRAAPYRESGIDVVWIHRATRLIPMRGLVEGRVSYDTV
jgi:competence CoiA-like predicted nuclease